MTAAIITATDISPEKAVAQLRHLALMFLAYALACADRAGLSPEEAARFFKERRPQPHPPVSTAGDLERIARDDAEFMALLHGRVTLERIADGWSISVPLSKDRSLLELFSPLDHYVRWGAEFDRELYPGVRWDTWLDGDTYRFELRLADLPK